MRTAPSALLALPLALLAGGCARAVAPLERPDASDVVASDVVPDRFDAAPEAALGCESTAARCAGPSEHELGLGSIDGNLWRAPLWVDDGYLVAFTSSQQSLNDGVIVASLDAEGQLRSGPIVAAEHGGVWAIARTAAGEGAILWSSSVDAFALSRFDAHGAALGVETAPVGAFDLASAAGQDFYVTNPGAAGVRVVRRGGTSDADTVALGAVSGNGVPRLVALGDRLAVVAVDGERCLRVRWVSASLAPIGSDWSVQCPPMAADAFALALIDAVPLGRELALVYVAERDVGGGTSAFRSGMSRVGFDPPGFAPPVELRCMGPNERVVSAAARADAARLYVAWSRFVAGETRWVALIDELAVDGTRVGEAPRTWSDGSRTQPLLTTSASGLRALTFAPRSGTQREALWLGAPCVLP